MQKLTERAGCLINKLIDPNILLKIFYCLYQVL